MARTATLARIAVRDLRQSTRHFIIFLLSLVLGTAIIAAVGLLLASAQQGIQNDAKGLLGGDLLVRTLYDPMPDEAKIFLKSKGDFTEYAAMRTMARVADESSDRADAINAQIAELKAVPRAYPLSGAFITQPKLTYDALYAKQDGAYGAAVEQELLDILSLSLGEYIRVGSQRFEIRAVIMREPDRLGANYSLGPRIMVSREALQTTGLVTFGSLINYVGLLDVGAQYDAQQVRKTLMSQYDDGGFQLRTAEDAAPGLKRALDRLGLFLTFAAIATLLIGGIGIANATQSYLTSRMLSIARFKFLGATQRETLTIYAVQMMLLCSVGIAFGLCLAVGVQQCVLMFFADQLPIATDAGITIKPLVVAASYGALTTMLFSAPALVSAVKTPPTQLLRYSAVTQNIGLKITPLLGIVLVACMAAIMLLTIDFVNNTRLTLVFFAAFGGAAIAFFGLGVAIKYMSKKLSVRPHINLSNRMALKNLGRRGSMTTSFSLSLGLSLTLMAALGIIAANFYEQLRYEPPSAAPDFFLIDIQPAQYEPFTKDMLALRGVEKLSLSPMVRGRITQLNHKPLTPDMVDSKVQWALQGERGITFASEPPENSTISEGEWWSEHYDGEPLVSFGAELAEGMGIKIGDVMTFNISGENIHARVANLREINWTTLQMNFGIVLSANTKVRVPPLYLGTLHASDDAEMEALRYLINNYPSISVVRIKATLKRVSELFGSVAVLILAVGGLTILAGVFVILGSLGTTLRNRAYESLLLNVLGQSKRAIRRVVTLEMSYLCVSGVALALALGSLISYALVDVMRLPRWIVIEEIYIGSAVLCIFLVVILSHWLIRTISATRPMDFLRNE